MKEILQMLIDMVVNMSKLLYQLSSNEIDMLEYLKHLEKRIEALENANKN